MLANSEHAAIRQPLAEEGAVGNAYEVGLAKP